MIRELHCSLVAKLCPTLCDPMGCSLPGSSIHGVSQARILEWGAIFLLHGIFSSQGSNLHLLHWQVESLPEPPGQPQRTLLGSNIWRSWWVAIQITQPLIPVPWLQRLHLQGSSFRKFRSLCCFPGSAVWGCCANMCVCLSIAAINTLSPYSRSSLISLRKNKGWKDFFRLQDAVLIQVNTSVSLAPC